MPKLKHRLYYNLVIAAIGFSALDCSSQITFGLTAGPSLNSQIRIDYGKYGKDPYTTEDIYNPRPGFSAGGFMEILMHASIKLQLGLVYSVRTSLNKSHHEFGNSVTTFEGRATTHYLELPVVFQINTGGRFSLEGGTSFSYLLSGKFESVMFLYGSDEKVLASKGDLDTDDYNRLDIGVLTGVSYQVTKQFSAGIRFRYNFFNPLIKEYEALFGKQRWVGAQLLINYHY